MGEDLKRIRSGMRDAQAEVDPWLDHWAGGRISQEEFDQRTDPARRRMAALEHELDQLRRNPGDVPGTDLDLLIADVDDSLTALHRRQVLLSAQAFAENSADQAHRVLAEQIRNLEDALAELRPRRAERAKFTEHATAQLQRAVQDGVIDQHTVDRLRTYLD